jgi:hypothetical protein
MEAMYASYDEIGRSYGATRRADPRIAEPIRPALGDAVSVVNVGAGSGAYEPADLDVISIEPAAAMIAQRPESNRPRRPGQRRRAPAAEQERRRRTRR